MRTKDTQSAPTSRTGWLSRRGLLRLATTSLALAIMAMPPADGAFARDDYRRYGHDEHWVSTWYASPQTSVIGLNPEEQPHTFNNQTIRHVVRVSAGGTQVRIRVSNEIGDQPLKIGAASIALHEVGSGIREGSLRQLTFGGNTSTVIPPGAPVLSDPVDLTIPDLASLAVSLYLPEQTGPATAHLLGRQTSFIAAGDTTETIRMEGAELTESRYFLTGVQVTAEEDAATIVTLGDSITDGFAATTDQNNRWPDVLAERLNVNNKGPERAVANAGISGNRVLHDIIGPNALARFDRDVLAQPGAEYVVVLEGINDIGFSEFLPDQEVSAEDIIAGYRQLIERAHSKGLKIYGATLTPFEGAGYFSEEGEAKRQAVNNWIRTSGAFDAVIDFDKVTRDPANPRRLLPAYDSGDNLHPSDAGYEAMANSIDLRLFHNGKGGKKDRY